MSSPSKQLGFLPMQKANNSNQTGFQIQTGVPIPNDSIKI